MNKIDKQYQELLKDILENGTIKKDRTGTGTISVFGRELRHKLSEGFPLLTSKKMYWRGIVTELIWFLKGDTNIKWLVNNNCNIWNGDAFKNYLNKTINCDTKWLKECEGLTLDGNGGKGICHRQFNKEEFIDKIKNDTEFSNKWGELGPIYGKQWVNWNGINQIENLIENLKNNPDSRRLMVNAWNVSDLPKMTLPPCHFGFQLYTRPLTKDELNDTKNLPNQPSRAISLKWYQRSADTALGIPYNIASYSLLLIIIAKMVNMVPDEVIGTFGDTHLYLNHIKGVEEQISRTSFDLPILNIVDNINHKDNMRDLIKSVKIDNFKIENYISHPPIKFNLSN